MDDVQAALAKVEAEIEALGVKVDKVEAEVEAARARKDEPEVTELRKEKEQLRKEKEQLRKEKEQLRTKEDKLREEKLIELRAKEQGMLASVGPVEVGSVGSLLTQHVRRPTRAANERDWRGCRHGEASADARCGEGVTQQFRAAQDVGKVPVFGR
jgi:SMC interacting uncharacterized protein involved in chromosome segregation